GGRRNCTCDGLADSKQSRFQFGTRPWVARGDFGLRAGRLALREVVAFGRHASSFALISRTVGSDGPAGGAASPTAAASAAPTASLRLWPRDSAKIARRRWTSGEIRTLNRPEYGRSGCFPSSWQQDR